jgi:hypothetical protein
VDPSDALGGSLTDAVVIVPGIMGSELIDEAGTVVWGLTPKVLASRFRLQGSRALAELRLATGEREGGTRLRPGGLLRFPGALPGLGGLEPYTTLLNRVRAESADPRAVSEFAYDWRLPVEHNASLLADHCIQQLRAWRSIVRRLGLPADPAEVRVQVVAHSMGGLLARAAVTGHGLSEVVRRVITLGTPYFGSVKTARLLDRGEGAPKFIPRDAARLLALTCPGVYDLLPRYRCVTDGAGLRHLTEADIGELGGDKEMARESQVRWDRLGLTTPQPPTGAWFAVVGSAQPTLQEVTLAGGVATYRESLQGTDHYGDGTVYRQSAAPLGLTAMPLPQRHGTLAKSAEAIAVVVDKLHGADTPPPLGTGQIGADIPDTATADCPLVVTVTGEDLLPHRVVVTSTNLETGRATHWPPGRREGATVVCRDGGLGPGLHRVEVKHGGWSAVSDLVLIVPPGDAADD